MSTTTRAFLLLTVLIWLVYAATLKFGFTELDDSIFYRDMADLFSTWKNAPGLFGRGVFTEHTDTYYRPLLMLSFLADQMVSKSGVFYHTINVLLHIVSMCLLYLLLKRWMKEIVALCITGIFAVHPLFVQVVAWIPGRNDSMVAIFVLGSVLSIIKYIETQEKKWWLFYMILFTGGLFTKETAVVIPVVSVVIVFLLGNRKDFWVPIALSVLPLSLWMWARNIAIQPIIKTGPNELVQAFMDNIGLSVQSVGKMLIPVNQSVFPMIEDTTYIYAL
ncbi:MAG: glycosyltransferase family 39 protein [Cytophagaceae bacterium]